MSERFLSIAEARRAGGLRLACLRAVPSPWTEAAKGIFHVKGLPCQYAAQAETDDPNAIAAWAGDSSVPVVAYENEPLRTGWAEILILAERLRPEPALVPATAAGRVQLFGLAHEICGELGLGWCVRLLKIRDGFDHGEGGGFAPDVAAFLAAKYGFNPMHVAQAEERSVQVLGLLDQVLGESRYFLEDRLTALDVYWATMANLLAPLPPEQLPMSRRLRAVYESTSETLLTELSPRLRAHQERIYRDHLELPVPL
jgi:glutathione S-transferase